MFEVGSLQMAQDKKFKILIELMHGIGDTVCSLPMLKLLRESFPNSEITVLVKFAVARDILYASHIAIDQVICMDIYKDPLKSIHLLREMRMKKFDYGISSCITPIKKAQLFMKAIRPKHIIGLQNRGQCFDTLDDQYHFVDANFLAISDLCTIPEQKVYPQIFPDEEKRAKLRERLDINVSQEKLVGICIGDADYSLKNRYLRTGKVYTRSWGIDNMVNLIQLLLKQKNIKVALIGGKVEKRLLPTLQEHQLLNNQRVIDFVGKTTIDESIALASLCSVMFGVDTGMQHIAAAVGTPTVSVFGPTNPRTHGAYAENANFVINSDVCGYQYCYGTRFYVNCPYERRCLRSISPERIYDVIERFL